MTTSKSGIQWSWNVHIKMAFNDFHTLHDICLYISEWQLVELCACWHDSNNNNNKIGGYRVPQSLTDSVAMNRADCRPGTKMQCRRSSMQSRMVCKSGKIPWILFALQMRNFLRQFFRNSDRYVTEGCTFSSMHHQVTRSPHKHTFVHSCCFHPSLCDALQSKLKIQWIFLETFSFFCAIQMKTMFKSNIFDYFCVAFGVLWHLSLLSCPYMKRSKCPVTQLFPQQLHTTRCMTWKMLDIRRWKKKPQRQIVYKRFGCQRSQCAACALQLPSSHSKGGNV